MTLSRRGLFKYGAAAGVAGVAAGLTGCVTALKQLSSSPDVTLDDGIPAGYEKIKCENLAKSKYSLKPEYADKKIWFELKPIYFHVDSVLGSGHGNYKKYSLTIRGPSFEINKELWKAAHATDTEALLKSKAIDGDGNPIVVGGRVEKYVNIYTFEPEFIIIDGNKISF